MRSSLLASTAVLLLSACATTRAPMPSAVPAQASAAAPVAAPAQQPGKLLAQLFADSDEGDLKLNPLSALFRGDMRYADQFGDFLSDAYLAANRQKTSDELARLAAIDRSSLTSDEQISYDVFQWQSALGQRFQSEKLDEYSRLTPVDHFNAVHVFFADLSSGQGAAPFATLADYENNLKRIDGFVKYMADAQTRMREGMAAGVTQPKLVMNNVFDQLNTQLKSGVDGSPYLMPTKKFPKEIAAADQARLTAAYRAVIGTKILPALAGMRDFVKKDYLPKCRDSVGLSGNPGGDRLYAFLVESQTTTKMTPDEIHALGLSEVARIKGEMEKIRKQVGFKGDLKAFFNYLRSDPKFKFKTKEALIATYGDIWKRLQPELPKLFNKMPKTAFEVRPVPAYAEANQAGAYYNQGTPDGSRPGVFYANTYDLPSRTSPGMETLFLHEAVPGHHFQISLAQENTSLPNFQRFGGNTAYVEGWALYTESLGYELGFFKDPFQNFGHLDDEMLRAMRLVVDTGLHAKGWTREQGIKYFMDNSGQSATDSKNEVERYIAIPGQALAYKIGQLTIRRLRTKAETELGAKFDIRAFHDQVLMSGALPLDVLEAKINRWIAATKSA
jgi:uncharacterized protein (DUF885 family)